ncbi:RluA family pseudouridine synthase [Marinisporobacter balticus]|uniref:Pseudouridine synthase n=1 Tax=Marinisporobacter balticus TaxID=2018667 RepID=A0A4R2KTX6_9FIRM|nr:RluA family pseudouridine synthase [Marinisporobacter balticus]TCO74566.1 23S rRNA pseudouridine1911/1915/1917 synthase [Marinisporobacter balticus]
MKKESNEISSNIITFQLEEAHTGMELKEILYEQMRLSSRLVRKLKRKKSIFVNDNRISFHAKLRKGDLVKIIMEEEPNQFEPEDIPIEVVYEDVDLLIVNKQPGIVVHPTKGHPTGTMANAIVYYMKEKKQNFKIRFVNRLDRDTSGLIIIAKNPFAQQELSKQMQENRIEKIYLAVVKGDVENHEGTICEPIGRPDTEEIRRRVYEEGQRSVTHYKVVNRLKGGTVLRIKLETGRTHQIRVHMSYIGYPIFGDELYGYVDENLIKRQALHAEMLSFYQPRTNDRVEIKASVPKDIEELIEKLSYR